MSSESYRELVGRVKEMIRPQGENELKDNTVALPFAFERAASRDWKPGHQVAGWNYFNQTTNGLRPHEFTILCGPSGIGKTTLLANLNLNFISRKIPTFAAPVEIGPEDYLQKMASIVSGKSELTTKEAWSDVRKSYFSLFFSNPNHILTCYESRVHHLQLMCDLLRSYEENGTQIALIDNLNFMMEVGDPRNQVAVMDRVVHDWIQFVKKLPIHVVMVMHPRKTENGRVESEYDIKGSSTAIQEAQNVILFNRLKRNEDAPHGAAPEYCREIKVVKCRKNGRAVGRRLIYSIDPVSERYDERANPDAPSAAPRVRGADPFSGNEKDDSF